LEQFSGLKIYLDTNILSNILSRKVNEDTLRALDELCDLDYVKLVTSKKTLEEFLNTRNDEIRIALKVLYKIITKIPSESLIREIPAVFGAVAFGEACFGGTVRREDPIFSELKNCFDKNDAEHIFQAIKANCNYFLTLDYKTILNRVPMYQSKLHIICPSFKITDPVKLLDYIRKEKP
jgi:predicted nucleic acid-binding protein